MAQLSMFSCEQHQEQLYYVWISKADIDVLYQSIWQNPIEGQVRRQATRPSCVLYALIVVTTEGKCCDFKFV